MSVSSKQASQKKKIKIKKGLLKISEYDRIQGLIRNEQFLEDLKKTIFPFKNKPKRKGLHILKAQAFENKYKISLPPYILYNTLQECIKEIKNHYMLSYAYSGAVRLIPAKLQSRGEHPFIEDGKYLTFKVDLDACKKDVMFYIALINKYINEFRNHKLWQELHGMDEF